MMCENCGRQLPLGGQIADNGDRLCDICFTIYNLSKDQMKLSFHNRGVDIDKELNQLKNKLGLSSISESHLMRKLMYGLVRNETIELNTLGEL